MSTFPTESELVSAGANFLQAKTEVERPLEEKIAYLVKEKNFTRPQIIAALNESNLYDISLEKVLNVLYIQFNSKKTSNKSKSKSTNKPQSNKPVNSPSKQMSSQPSNINTPNNSNTGWGFWKTFGTSLGLSIATSLTAFVTSTNVAKNLVIENEKMIKTEMKKLKTEVCEQAELDRERQHRDLMEVVNSLKRQADCVEQNLNVLKQSIELISTQIKFTNNTDNEKLKGINMGNIGNDLSDASSITSIHSNNNLLQKTKSNLMSVQSLLSEHVQGNDDNDFPWMNKELIPKTNNDQKDEKNDNDITLDEKDVEEIYHKNWKELIKTLPTEHDMIKDNIIQLFKEWKMIIHQNQKTTDKSTDDDIKYELTFDKLKSGLSQLKFYITKIVKQPELETVRKINTFNKQYKERIKCIYNIDKLFELIGFEKTKDKYFWNIKLLINKDDKNNEKMSQFHEKQIDFLSGFQKVLQYICTDEQLPYDINLKIEELKNDSTEALSDDKKASELELEKKNENDTKQVDENDGKENKILEVDDKKEVSQNVTDTNMVVDGDELLQKKKTEEIDDLKETEVEEAPHSQSFMEIAQMVQQGKTPDDVRTDIDDMPPDPNAPPTESKIPIQKKPFESIKEEDEVGDEWFSKYT